jgi:DNA-nicking Smr family endonuclease
MNDDDRRAFREAMRGVRPLQSAKHPKAKERPRKRVRASFSRADRLSVLAESMADLRKPLAPVIESGEEIKYRSERISEIEFRRLRRGQFRIEAELDLHGLNATAAEHELKTFLAWSYAQGLRVIRIVHGKGHRSGTRGPVLRALVNHQLQRTSAVLAFASAREVDGGTGACVVLLDLKQSARSRVPPSRRRGR